MQRAVKQLSIALLALMLTSLMSPTTRAAQVQDRPRQSLESISDAVRTFALGHHGHAEGLEVTTARLDQRLRLGHCDSPLATFWAPGSAHVGNTTVGVRCDGTRPWKLFVPTRVSKLADVAVAAVALTRGRRLGPGDLRTERRDLATLPRDAVHDPEQVFGYVVRQSAGVGQVVGTRMLTAPLLVERGQGVELLSSIAGLQIRMAGVAMDDGSRGELVRVRNPVSNRVIRARVVGSGRVRLGTLN